LKVFDWPRVWGWGSCHDGYGVSRAYHHRPPTTGTHNDKPPPPLPTITVNHNPPQQPQPTTTTINHNNKQQPQPTATSTNTNHTDQPRQVPTALRALDQFRQYKDEEVVVLNNILRHEVNAGYTLGEVYRRGIVYTYVYRIYNV
jgi:hypothetical protein